MPIDRAKIRSLPSGPGVYVFRDSAGVPIYVGKAVSLRKRVVQHFSGEPIDVRELRMREETKEIETIVTKNEVEALILENNLIKYYKPELNVMLKDDKSYPYIKLTKEKFPRVLLTRRIVSDGSYYFGPYTDAGAARLTVKHLRQAFPIRSCTLDLNGKKTYEPCLDYQIGLCSAPCAGKVPEEEYRELVQGFASVLKGSYKKVLADLYSKMRDAASAMRYEEAANLRDRIIALEKLSTKQYAQLPGWSDYDVVEATGEAAAVLHFRKGSLIGRETLKLSSPDGMSRGDLLREFLQLFYSSGRTPANTVLVSSEIVEHLTGLSAWLKTKNPDVKVRGPSTDLERRLLDMCVSNLPTVSYTYTLSELRKLLKAERPIRIITGFDISNIGAKSSYGSAVTFVDGEKSRKGYRIYSIRGVRGQNDFAKIRETVARHIKNALAGKVVKPDMLLIDGGPIQLRYALQGLRMLHASDIYAISLAKREETICLPSGEEIKLPRNSPVLQLLQRVRDESHRFALLYHRKSRSKASLESVLNSIPGMGSERLRSLLTRFPTVESLRGASVEDLAKVPGISVRMARTILEAV
ncbi:MAG: excinuclease ABC subunit UvrC [Thermoprotei archaeon]